MRKLETPNGEQIQVQTDPQHWYYATWWPNMQPHYDRGQTINTNWTMSSTKHVGRHRMPEAN